MKRRGEGCVTRKGMERREAGEKQKGGSRVFRALAKILS